MILQVQISESLTVKPSAWLIKLLTVHEKMNEIENEKA